MRKVFVFAACLVLLLASVAHAEYFKFVSNGSFDVNITDPGGTGNTFVKLYDVEYGTPAAAYKAFCVDFATVAAGGEYNNYYMINVPNLAAYNEAAYIFANYGTVNGAAAQLAVWEVVFEQLSGGGVKTVVGTNTAERGVFYVNSGISPADLALADQWANEALTHADFNTESFRLLVSPSREGYYGNNYQDVIIRVPEPGVLTLLGLGLIALGVTRRRD